MTYASAEAPQPGDHVRSKKPGPYGLSPHVGTVTETLLAGQVVAVRWPNKKKPVQMHAEDLVLVGDATVTEQNGVSE